MELKYKILEDSRCIYTVKVEINCRYQSLLRPSLGICCKADLQQYLMDTIVPIINSVGIATLETVSIVNSVEGGLAEAVHHGNGRFTILLSVNIIRDLLYEQNGNHAVGIIKHELYHCKDYIAITATLPHPLPDFHARPKSFSEMFMYQGYAFLSEYIAFRGSCELSPKNELETKGMVLMLKTLYMRAQETIGWLQTRLKQSRYCDEDFTDRYGSIYEFFYGIVKRIAFGHGAQCDFCYDLAPEIQTYIKRIDGFLIKYYQAYPLGITLDSFEKFGRMLFSLLELYGLHMTPEIAGFNLAYNEDSDIMEKRLDDWDCLD